MTKLKNVFFTAGLATGIAFNNPELMSIASDAAKEMIDNIRKKPYVNVSLKQGKPEDNVPLPGSYYNPHI